METGLVESYAGSSVVLFDAVCPLCTWSARFIARNDPQRRFRFAALQSPAGKELIRQAGIPEVHVAGSSLALLSDGRSFVTSDAVFEIARFLRKPWSWVAQLRVLPDWFREWVYWTVAIHRPRRQSACALGEELYSRMLPGGNVV